MFNLIGLVVTIITIVLQVIAIPEFIWDAYPFLVWFPLLVVSIVWLLSVGGLEGTFNGIDFD